MLSVNSLIIFIHLFLYLQLLRFSINSPYINFDISHSTQLGNRGLILSVQWYFNSFSSLKIVLVFTLLNSFTNKQDKNSLQLNKNDIIFEQPNHGKWSIFPILYGRLKYVKMTRVSCTYLCSQNKELIQIVSTNRDVISANYARI